MLPFHLSRNPWRPEIYQFLLNLIENWSAGIFFCSRSLKRLLDKSVAAERFNLIIVFIHYGSKKQQASSDVNLYYLQYYTLAQMHPAFH